MLTSPKPDRFGAKVSKGLFLAFLTLTSRVYAITLPVEENFDDAVADGFVTAGASGAYTINSDSIGHNYKAVVSAGSGNVTGSAGLVIDDAATTSFVVSTKMVISSFTAPGSGGVNAGLGLYSNTVDFSTGGQYRLLYQLTQGNAGKLQILRNGSSVALSTAILPPRLNVPYILQAIITHADGEVTIKGLLSDDTSTITVSVTDPAPLPGSYFGYRTAVNAVGGTAAITVRYDDFSVISSIVEPSSGDQTVGGNLFVDGTLDITGNALFLGSQGDNYGAAYFYENSVLTSHLSSPEGLWIWKRDTEITMTLDSSNVLRLPDPAFPEGGIRLDPVGYSEIGGPLLLFGHDNRAPLQEISDETSLLTVGLGDARYLQSGGASSSEFSTLTVTGPARFEGTVHIAPQGDLSMGEFTSEPESP